MTDQAQEDTVKVGHEQIDTVWVGNDGSCSKGPGWGGTHVAALELTW